MDNTKDKQAPDERIERMEAKLIEQEHRLWGVLKNFLARKQWEPGDPRRRATWLALLWVWFGPMTVAAGGGCATLLILIWQNYLIKGQNSLIQEQNAHFRDQLGKMDDQIKSTQIANRKSERSHLIGVLWDTIPTDNPAGKEPPKANVRTRQEALVRFIELEQERIHESTTGTAPKKLIDLSRAILSSVYANELNLQDVTTISFKGADFRRAFLANTKFPVADFSEARLDSAVFNGCQFEAAQFRDSLHEETSFLHATIGSADVYNVNFLNCNFFMADMRDAKFRNSSFEGRSLVRTNCDGALFDQVEFRISKQTICSACSTKDCDRENHPYITFSSFRNAVFSEVTFEFNNLSNIRLDGAEFRNTSLRHVNLSGSLMSSANLVHADLRNADLTETVLIGANLASANLQDSKMTKSDLRDAILTDADLRGAIINDVNLSGANLEGVLIYDLPHDWLDESKWTTVPYEDSLAEDATYADFMIDNPFDQHQTLKIRSRVSDQ